MASAVVLGFFWQIRGMVLLPFLLFCVAATKLVYTEGVCIRQDRKLQETLSFLEIANKDLLRNVVNILSSRTDRTANASLRVLAIALSPDEQTIYFSEKFMVPPLPAESTYFRTLVMRAELRDNQTVARNLTPVLGPWPFNGNLGSNDPNSSFIYNSSHSQNVWVNGSDVRGLLMLDSATIVASDDRNNAVWRVDLGSGKGTKIGDVRSPIQIARHPLQNALFVSTNSRIEKLTLAVPWLQAEVLAGPVDSSGGNYQDNPNSSLVRFQDPFIGPQAISNDGNILYVADFWNDAVRRVRTDTGGTETIAGGGSRSLLAPEGGFNRSRSLALTQDGCNLFVSERDRGRIHWLRFSKPYGEVIALETVATLWQADRLSAEAILSIALANSDRYLFAGTGDGQILKLEIRTSLLGCPKNGNRHLMVIGVSVGLVLCLIALIVIRIFIFQKGWFGPRIVVSEGTPLTGLPSTQATSSVTGVSVISESDAEWLAANNIYKFLWSAIETAMNEGSCLTGQGGGYGDVYRANLMVGKTMMEVAIKVMRGEFNEVKYKQFLSEVNTLSHVRHRNLCKLLGYCMEENRCILVYPFITGGSLYDRLHKTRTAMVEPHDVPGSDGSNNKGKREPLTWMERVTIAKQVATCLRYLHLELEQPIIHRDIKSHNVLISGEGKHVQGYVSDFGLAKPGNVQGTDRVTSSGLTTVMTLTQSGTPGYMAPEYVYESKLTRSTDVFAFGVVLLEMLTIRKAIVKLGEEVSIPLYSWVRQKRDHEILDEYLQNSLTPEELKSVAEVLALAHQCTDDRISKRPTMADVTKALEAVIAGLPQ